LLNQISLYWIIFVPGQNFRQETLLVSADFWTTVPIAHKNGAQNIICNRIKSASKEEASAISGSGKPCKAYFHNNIDG